MARSEYIYTAAEHCGNSTAAGPAVGGRSHKQAGAEFLFTEAKGANVAFNPRGLRTT